MVCAWVTNLHIQNKGRISNDAALINSLVALTLAGRAGGIGPFVVDFDFRVSYAVGHRLLTRIAGFAQAYFLNDTRLF